MNDKSEEKSMANEEERDGGAVAPLTPERPDPLVNLRYWLAQSGSEEFVHESGELFSLFRGHLLNTLTDEDRNLIVEMRKRLPYLLSLNVPPSVSYEGVRVRLMRQAETERRMSREARLDIDSTIHCSRAEGLEAAAEIVEEKAKKAGGEDWQGRAAHPIDATDSEELAAAARQHDADRQTIKALYATVVEAQQIAGKALRYPWFKDDPKNFPDATEEDGVCVGEHVTESIVDELAKEYADAVGRAERAEAALRDAVFLGGIQVSTWAGGFLLNGRPVSANLPDLENYLREKDKGANGALREQNEEGRG